MHFSWNYQGLLIMMLATLCRLISSDDTRVLDRSISSHQDHRRLSPPSLVEKTNRQKHLTLFRVIVHMPEVESSHLRESHPQRSMKQTPQHSFSSLKSGKAVFLFHKGSGCCANDQTSNVRANKDLLFLPIFARVLFDRINEVRPLPRVRLSIISIDREYLIDSCSKLDYGSLEGKSLRKKQYRFYDHIKIYLGTAIIETSAMKFTVTAFFMLSLILVILIGYW